MKILVTGNCQARAIAAILQTSGNFDVLPPIILHLATSDQASRHYRQLSEADVVFAQYTAPQFQPSHLSSQCLKENHPTKTFVWPNVFYAGQQPYLRYLNHPVLRRLGGPLDAVHDLRLLFQWQAARGLGHYPEELSSPTWAKAVHEDSLDMLYNRENQCDIRGIAEVVANYHDKRRLFFTFNHPCLFLLEEVARRMLRAIGVSPEHRICIRPEPLGEIVPPSTWFDFTADDHTLWGVNVELESGGLITSTTRRPYSVDALQAAAFRCYDHMSEALLSGKVSASPRLSVDTVLDQLCG